MKLVSYRQVIIKKSEKIHFKDNNLVVDKEGVSTSLPLEDINYILIEDQTTVITTRLLAELSKNAVSLIICDEKYLPISIMYPYNYHFKQLENFNNQVILPEESKKELWDLIIKQKIKNSIEVLEMTTKDETVIFKLNEYIDEVENGDEKNREALAAKMYFRSLFGSDFIRFYDNAVNSALNYGYTILTSAILRNLSVYGLNSFLGIHHYSKVNNFNLAYDLLEPYRFIVDKFIYDNMEELISPLSFDTRQKLLNLLNSEVIVNNKKYTVEFSIGLLVKSYVKSFNSNEISLDLPSLSYE